MRGSQWAGFDLLARDGAEALDEGMDALRAALHRVVR